eukprot:GHUV01040203.1.p1 GENE.GHUV01040203.1~~GHUV01040203.1.p1  ORF type:complete len:102 (+),score=5.99 GHUV01040203.1:820-1125(+)
MMQGSQHTICNVPFCPVLRATQKLDGTNLHCTAKDPTQTHICSTQNEVPSLYDGWCSHREALITTFKAEFHYAVETWMMATKQQGLSGCSKVLLLCMCIHA